jgi:uncharacterized membrane protein YphA (DoxX/SURF4 family)
MKPMNRTIAHRIITQEWRTRMSGAKRRYVLKKRLLLAVPIILSLVWILASIDKIRHPLAFSQLIYNYQILPHAFINLTALILPWLELLLGIPLITGVWLPGAAVLTNLLLLTFFADLLFNLARGLNIHCACFSTSTEGARPLYGISRGMRSFSYWEGIFLRGPLSVLGQRVIETGRLGRG